MLSRERHAHGVAGHGAEMVDQTGEAIDAVAIGVALDRLLGPRGWRGLCRHHRRRALGARAIEIGVVEQERGQRLAQMPFDIIGEHAQKDMGPHAIGIPVPNGADLEIDGLHGAERPLDPREIFVRLDRMRSAEILGRHGGPDDIDAIEPGFGRDLRGLAGKGEVAIADIEGEVFGHLLGVHDFANRRSRSLQRPTARAV